MVQINGSDWTLNVSERDLVRIAMRQLRDAGEPITLQSVADLSGLSIPQVKAVAQAEQSRQASNGGRE